MVHTWVLFRFALHVMACWNSGSNLSFEWHDKSLCGLTCCQLLLNFWVCLSNSGLLLFDYASTRMTIGQVKLWYSDQTTICDSNGMFQCNVLSLIMCVLVLLLAMTDCQVCLSNSGLLLFEHISMHKTYGTGKAWILRQLPATYLLVCSCCCLLSLFFARRDCGSHYYPYP